MSANVDYEFYSAVYMGSEADSASFPALCARASDIVSAMTRWADVSKLPEWIQTLVKKAVCAQIDYFAVNGLDSIAGGDGQGFTVGKVSVGGATDTGMKGRMSTHISPMVTTYLEQTGLLNPQVETAPDMPLIGWWY